MLRSPAPPQYPYELERETVNRRNKVQVQNQNKKQAKPQIKNNKRKKTETVMMVTAVHRGRDHLLRSLDLIKKDDLGVPTIQCSINKCFFYKAICDTGSGVYIMAKVTYEFLYGSMPLDPTYAQLQMVD